jgi:hypothetical protein
MVKTRTSAGRDFSAIKNPRASGNQNADDIARAVVKVLGEQNSQIGF